jgi:predicted acylesterase/phospholipase RssA
MKPEVLVIGPGGMKVFLQLGALLELERMNILENVSVFVGCSVGALVSLLLVIGYTTIEIINDVFNEDILNYLVDKFDFEKIYQSTGLIDPVNIRNKLSQKLIKKIGFVPNLQQLYLMTGKKFYSVAYNLNKDRVELFSYETTPDCLCVEAVLLSMNIPGIFYQMKYKEDYYIDGALGNPYPVDLFDDGRTMVLGISVDSETLIQMKSGIEYLYKIIQTPMVQIKQRIISDCSSLCRHLIIKSKYFDTLGISLTDDNKIEMIKQGIEQCTEFLQSDNIKNLV